MPSNLRCLIFEEYIKHANITEEKGRKMGEKKEILKQILCPAVRTVVGQNPFLGVLAYVLLKRNLRTAADC